MFEPYCWSSIWKSSDWWILSSDISDIKLFFCLLKLKKQKAGPNCGGTLRLISLSAAARLRPLFSVSGLSPVKLPAGLTLATLRNSLRRESQLLEFYFLVKWRLEKEIKQIFKNLKKCVPDTSCTQIHSSRNRKHAGTDGKSPPGAWPKLLRGKRCLHFSWTKTTQSNKNPLRVGTPVTIKSHRLFVSRTCGEWSIFLINISFSCGSCHWERFVHQSICQRMFYLYELNIWSPPQLPWRENRGTPWTARQLNSVHLLEVKKYQSFTQNEIISALLSSLHSATATCNFIFADKQVVFSPCIYLSRCKI